MENYIKPTTKLYVAINTKGEIVNNSDLKGFGPAFAFTDEKINGVEHYALVIDYNFNKQGAFSILDCSKITAAMIARRYCEKHHISPTKRSWLYQDNYENIYQVVDENDTEYNFHISRSYHEDGRLRDFYGVYISIDEKGKAIDIIEISNINNL